MNAPPRLRSLLGILAEAGGPVPVDELAVRLRVSRRTVFRELESAAGFLPPYGLRLDRAGGKGVQLAGDEAGKERLMQAVKTKKNPQPAGRDERRIMLALVLLAEPEPQKLYHYSKLLRVSEATVSGDLDAVEAVFAKFGAGVSRKSGFGVAATGSESAIRRAICGALAEAGRIGGQFRAGLPFPAREVSARIGELMETEFAPRLGHMAPESKEALAAYMAVAVSRIAAGNTIAEADAEPAPGILPPAYYFAEGLESAFSIQFSESERKNLALYLAALRQSAHFAGPQGAARERPMLGLAYRLIENFDPELAPFLKLDDKLVDGLALHMESAIVRMRAQVELACPLLDELSRSYPDILEKSARALESLGEPGGMSKNEAGFLATHFGAAVFRMREQGKRRRARIAVVCAGGIGASHFMASQINKAFPRQVETEIRMPDDADWSCLDLCVTSIPIPISSQSPLNDAQIPVIQAGPLLNEKDLAAIKDFLDRRPNDAPPARPGAEPSLLESCKIAAELLSDARALLFGFSSATIESGCDFDRLARLVGYRFGSSEENGRTIYDALLERERLSTQVIPSLELVLLHARAAGVQRPVFSLILPENGAFTAPSLQNSRCCIVMLAPKDAGRGTLAMMGRISASLLEYPRFLETIKSGDKDGAYAMLERIVREHLADSIVF